MDINLIELQRNCPATAVIIEDNEISNLENALVMNANKLDIEEDIEVYKKLEVKSKFSKISYLIIRGIDNISIDDQQNFVGIVKDRVIKSKTLPENLIIVFTVKSKNNLKFINTNLYKLCVIA